MTPKDTAILIDQCLAQLSSYFYSPTADGFKYRDPQPNSTQNVYKLEH